MVRFTGIFKKLDPKLLFEDNCSAVLDCCHYGLSSAGGAMDIIYVLFDTTRSTKNQVVTQKNKSFIIISVIQPIIPVQG